MADRLEIWKYQFQSFIYNTESHIMITKETTEYLKRFLSKL